MEANHRNNQRGGEMIVVGETEVHASKKRYGAFGDTRRKSPTNETLTAQGSSSMQASSTQTAQAMQHVHNEKLRMKQEYQNIRR